MSNQYQVDKPSGIKWEAPTYHGIEWHPRQALPKPHKEISKDEFLKLFLLDQYGLRGTHYDQFFIPNDSQVDPYKDGYPTVPLSPVNFYWFPDHGLAVARIYNSKNSWESSIRLFEKSGFGYEFRFFKIGCDHDYTESNPRQFEHTYLCKKCGYTFSVDSSG